MPRQAQGEPQQALRGHRGQGDLNCIIFQLKTVLEFAHAPARPRESPKRPSETLGAREAPNASLFQLNTVLEFALGLDRPKESPNKLSEAPSQRDPKCIIFQLKTFDFGLGSAILLNEVLS